MKISTKGRYALRFLIDLAEHQQDGFVALKDIANRQDLSKKYLEQIVSVLNKPNILIANRGFQGGYKLAQEPSCYTVGDILRITEGGLAPITCLENEVNMCDRCDKCETLFVWQGLYDTITEYLDSITLQDIIDNKNNNLDFVI